MATKDFVVKSGLQVRSNVVVGAYSNNTTPISNGIAVSGGVGVGTSSLAATTKFEVQGGNVKLGTEGYGLVFSDGSFQSTAATSTNPGGTTGAVQYNNGTGFGGDANNFYYDSTNYRLGIGTSGLTGATLNVWGNVPSLFNTKTSASQSSDSQIIVGNSTTTGATFGQKGDLTASYIKHGSSTKITWNSTGVGINNITPVNALDVAGGTVIGSGFSWAGASTAPTDGLAVQGSVGIGTTSPNTALHVVGTQVNTSTTGIGTSTTTGVVAGNVFAVFGNAQFSSNVFASGFTGTHYGAWNGTTIGTAYGGTGLGGATPFSANGIMYASSTSALTTLANGTTGQVLLATTGSAPSWGQVSLTAGVTGTLPIANGGTNATATPTAGAVSYGTGSAYAFSAAGTSGNLLLSGGTGAPTWGLSYSTSALGNSIVARDASGNITAALGTFSSIVSTGGANISVSTASTSTTTGAIITAGGAGIAGNLNVGGTINTLSGVVGVGTSATAGLRSGDQLVVYTGNIDIGTTGKGLVFPDGSFQTVAFNSTNAVTSFSAGTTGLTPNTGTAGAITLAGTLNAANGGTGQSSYTIGDILFASGATALSKLAGVATGNVLISGGVGVAPSWGKIGLTTHVSGTLPVANGGTNATATPTAGAVSYGTGSAYAFTAAGTSGNILISGGTGAPTWGQSYTSSNVPNSVVSRDASGNFSAGTITAATGLTVTTGGINVTGVTSQFTGNVSITGNLNVSGNINTINSNVLVVSDPIIYIGEDNPANVWDLGILGSYTTDIYRHTGLLRNHTDGTWTIFDNLITEPTQTINWSQAGLNYGSFKVGNINVAASTASTSTTSGALTVVGGVGIGGNIYGGANVVISTAGKGVVFGDGTFQTTAYPGSTGVVTSFSAGTTGLTPSTGTTGAVTLAGTLNAANGGTGQSSYAIGDILFASGATALSKLAGVATGNVLISGGVATAPSYGKVGLTTHVSGTLPVANGGTGLTSGTSGGVLYYSAAGTLASSAALAANSLVVGGGAGVAPSTITTGTGVVTALGVNTGSAGAFVVNGGALGTPSSGTLTNATGLPLTTGVTGTLPVGNGGTGATTFTTNGLLYGNGTNAVQVTAQGGANTILVANAGAPSFSATPTIGTSVTVPLVIGGTAASSSLTLQSTSATGTSDSILFKVGNNGATTAMTINTTGNVGIGTSTMSNRLEVWGGNIDISQTGFGLVFPDNTFQTTAFSSTSAVTSFSAGTTGLTPSTGTTGAVTLAGTLNAANGGTGQSSYAIGDILFASGATALSKLAGVATGNVLISGGVSTAPSYGKVGLTTHVTGTLPVANGGTGLTSGTSGGVLYYSAAGTLASSAALAASAIVVGGGAGGAPSTITTGTGVTTALGVNTGSAGAFVVNGGALGTPSSGNLISCTSLPLTTGVTGTLPVANGGTGLTSGTSGGVLFYSASGTLASSSALAANSIVVGGGAGVAPSTITTGTGVVSALGVNTGTAGAFVVNGGALGTPSSGTLTNATGLPLSTGVTGTLPVGNGGTGLTSYTTGDIIFASASNTLASLADVATGNVIISGGVGANPSYGKVGLTTHVTGTLPVANGGTGLTSGTSGGVLFYSAAGTLASSAALAANSIVVGGGAGVAPSTITTGTGVVTALGVNTGSAGAFVVNGGALGTPSSGNLISCTSLPLTTGVTGVLPLANGGTNKNLTASNGGIVWTDTDSMEVLAASATVGNVLVSGGAGAPTWGASISSTNGAGNIVARDSSGNFTASNITVTGVTFGQIVNYTISTTTASAAQATVDSFPTATYRAAEYQISITNGSTYEIVKLTVIHDGTNAYTVEYDNVFTSATLANWDASVSGGNCNLLVTPVNATSTTYKIARTLWVV